MTEQVTAAPRLYPTLRYRDAEAALRWLQEVLGFSERVVYRRDGVVAHAELSLGPSILMLGQARDDGYDLLVGDPNGRRTDAIYLAVDDADAMFRQVQASGATTGAATGATTGATIVTPLHDTDYGSRDFACRDPEGNLWYIGTYRPAAGEPPLPH